MARPGFICSATLPLRFYTLVLLLVAVVWPGCTALGGGGRAQVRSLASGATLAADLPTRVYTSADSSTADFYMTDLPEAVWTQGADLSNLSGTLMHVHMFIAPKAGETPIADTASTSIVRCVVLARGEVGVYGGGGFFINGGKPGGKNFSGSVWQGTLRLVSATPAFVDRLGPSSFSGSFSARRDEGTAAAIERAMRTMMSVTKPLNAPDPAAP
jgi:hypothetical protein